MFQIDEEAALRSIQSLKETDKNSSYYIDRFADFPYGASSGFLMVESVSDVPFYNKFKLEYESKGLPSEIEENSDEIFGEDWEKINHWVTAINTRQSVGTLVEVYKNKLTGEYRYQIFKDISIGTRLAFKMKMRSLDYLSLFYHHEAELKAQKKLKKILRSMQYRDFILTGCFSEANTKSGIIYLLRKGLPTLAFRKDKEKGFRFIAALCMHPLGYLDRSFAGLLVPSDELIAHLLYIRADEYRFWKKSNHHSIHHSEAGL